MILTVTPNSALDRILFIEEWSPGLPMRTDGYHDCIGGKGMDCSVVLTHLGVDTVGLVFEAGATGKEMLAVAERYGIETEAVRVEGETRLALVICETEHERHSHIMAGALRVNDEHLEVLWRRFRRRVDEADWVIGAGTLSPGCPTSFYRDLVVAAAETETPVLIDCAREPLLASLPARPAIVKMNTEEFAVTFGVRPESMEGWIGESYRIFRAHEMPALVLTIGVEGMIAFSAEGAFQVKPPPQKPVNAAGAGDAASAALVWRLAEGDDWSAALQWAGAVSAATVLTEGTADCHMDEIERIRGDVVVSQLNVAG